MTQYYSNTTAYVIAERLQSLDSPVIPKHRIRERPATPIPASTSVGPRSTVCLLIGVLAAAAAAAAAVIMYLAYKRERNRPEYQVDAVEWTEGMKSVLLPFKIMTDLSKDIRVEWRQLFPRNNLVFGYQLDSNSTVKLCGDFTDRTDMKEDLLRSADFSLTLKNPSSDDCGLYICTVLKEGQILRQKAVALTGVTGQ
ncbi:hypothetical protein EXN66_Car014111 [Channa argus]|uniref:Ig-like domain-containing protein n=1 Tax=Channa argus TaxID=215402 RepID=A0A6G1Q713_CHAAH|nr:hypothetical protein EXN66_Car014111 [Channa argus]